MEAIVLHLMHADGAYMITGLGRSPAGVILVNGRLAAFLRRRNPAIRVMLPEEDPDRIQVARAVAQKLAEVAIIRQSRRGGLFIGTVNDASTADHFLSRFLEESGFVPTAAGFQMRRVPTASVGKVGNHLSNDESAGDD